MYTIKQAASRSGVPVELLRAWERRYGVVDPGRTPSGYRLYDDASIARLRAMRRLIDEGWAPSTAAARIKELSESDISQIAGAAASGGVARPMAASDLSRAFVDAAQDFDEPAVETVLDDMFSRGSFEQVTTELVMPALVALGDGWAAGKLDVAAEHAAAGAVQRRLGMAFVAAGLPRQESVVLVGMPPGSLHELGALAFATSARRAGISVRYVGADLPTSDWLDAVLRTRARAVVIGVVISSDVAAALQVARAIREQHPEVLICLGGRHAPAVPTDGLSPLQVLPAEFGRAVTALLEELDGRAA